MNIILALFFMVFWRVCDYQAIGNWSHDLSDGTTLHGRAEFVDLEDTAEILYRGPCDLGQAVDMWRVSPTHAEILNDKEFDHAVMIMIPDPYHEDWCYMAVNYKK